MSHQVTAREWRPKTFESLVGQAHVVKALTNALTQQRLHHAYLFTGTRGVGKTTLARILAKCLLCEQGISPSPCGQCEPCQSVDTGHCIDLIEVDAASRTKVEDTRELLDNVQYLPTRARYKIYLIDEVHMLSTHSFNALLKTLEEPPEHVIFILATTDPQKLPVTVLSRCLQFHLKHLPHTQISGQLEHILQQQGLSFDTPALTLIAQAADGSMRDALSLLDQAIAYGQGALREAEVRELLGTIDPQAISTLLESLRDDNGEALLATSRAIAEESGDFHQALEALTHALHNISVLQVVGVQGLAETQAYADLSSFAEAFAPEEIQLYYQIALQGRRDLPFAASPRIGFEMTLMRLLAFKPKPQAELTRSSHPEGASPRDLPLSRSKPEQREPQQRDLPRSRSAPSSVIARAQSPKPEPQAELTRSSHPEGASPRVLPASRSKPESSAPQPRDLPASHSAPEESPGNLPVPWDTLIGELKLTGMAQTLASHCVVKAYNGHALSCLLSPKHTPLHNNAVVSRINDALTRYFKKDVKLDIQIKDMDAETPAERQAKVQSEVLDVAKADLKADPHVVAMQAQFDAKIDEDSIKPMQKDSLT